MTSGVRRVAAVALAGMLLTATRSAAHHEILGKFDDKKPVTLSGVVTLVDWKNPHVHIFMNVKDAKGVLNWAIELDSPIELQQSGWNQDTVKPGETITVTGMAARNGSRQAWGSSVVLGGTGKRVLNANLTPPPAPPQPRPTPRWADKQPRLGTVPGGAQGYWAYPSATVMVETGVTAPMSRWCLLKNIAEVQYVAEM
jgi:hypothetical protein